MLVMYGDENTLLIAIVESEIADLRKTRTLEYRGFRQLVKDIIIIYGKTKEDVIQQITAAGIPVDDVIAQKYYAGGRTDTPQKDH